MFAIRHPAVRNLWFDFESCTWTFSQASRTTFGSETAAAEWATLTQDGGLVVAI